MILAKFKMSEQVTEEKWILSWKEKLFNEDSTIKEIKEWANKISLAKPESRMIEITLSEPE